MPRSPTLPTVSAVRGASDIPTRDRLPSLTSLRFYAALLVVVYHLSRQMGSIAGISQVAWYGRTGVTFFFVLSGFVLAWTYQDMMPSLRTFWWRRFARIWPLLAVATIGSTILYLIMDVPVPLVSVAAALATLHAWIPSPVIVRGGNGATWSLSDEAFFYLCFPLVLHLIKGISVRAKLWAAGAATLVLTATWVLITATLDDTFRLMWAIDYLPASRLMQFVVGVAIGSAVRSGWRPRIRLDLAVALVIAFHLLLYAWGHFAQESRWGPYSASHVLATPFFALVVLAAAVRDLDGRTGLLGARWGLRLGHWSFAWYLVHEMFLRSWVFMLGPPTGLLRTLLGWSAVLVASLACAGLLYRFVEHPSERRLRRLTAD